LPRCCRPARPAELTLASGRVRRLPMSVPDQLALDLPGVAPPPPDVLEGLSDHDHAVAIRVLTRLMVKMIAPALAGEQVAGDE
jgi:hypothetical protein